MCCNTGEQQQYQPTVQQECMQHARNQRLSLAFIFHNNLNFLERMDTRTAANVLLQLFVLCRVYGSTFRGVDLSVNSSRFCIAAVR